MTASNDILEELHELVGKELVKRIKAGTATAQDFAQAIKFLKDNGIEAIPNGDSALGQLESAVKNLPFSDPEDPTLQH